MSRADNVFDVIHLDIWGLYRTTTYNGCRFFLTMIDHNLRMTWLYILRMKTDVFSVLKSFFILVQTQFSMQVKRVRSNNDTEFFNNEYGNLFKSLGIIHESSCPHTPQ